MNTCTEIIPGFIRDTADEAGNFKPGYALFPDII
jgi:hypothetical protein